MKPVALTLPFPPSVNGLFPSGKQAKTKITVVAGKVRRVAGKVRRFPSQKYKAWRKEAGIAIRLAGRPVVSGPVSISVDLAPGDRRLRDSDNYLKALLDLLVSMAVIEADDARIVRAVSSRWVEVERPPVARITITPV